MNSRYLRLAAACAGVAVAMGAFGAHGLKTMVSAEMLDVYKTAVNYQMWHALGLGLIAMMEQQRPAQRLLRYAAWFMFSGIVLFSGSLYLLVLLQQKWLGLITPVGGVAFIAAWSLLFCAAQGKNDLIKPLSSPR